MQSTEDMERLYQKSVDELEVSLRKKNYGELSPEQKARLVNILRVLEQLHADLGGKTIDLATMLGTFKGSDYSVELLKFLEELGKTLAECATQADRLRIRMEGNRVTEDLAGLVERGRSEDLATMIRYLNNVSQQIADLVGQYKADLVKQAAHRDSEQETLDRLNKVLSYYEAA